MLRVEGKVHCDLQLSRTLLLDTQLKWDVPVFRSVGLRCSHRCGSFHPPPGWVSICLLRSDELLDEVLLPVLVVFPKAKNSPSRFADHVLQIKLTGGRKAEALEEKSQI